MTTSDVGERLRAFHAKNLEYLRAGYDRMAAARHVVAAAGALHGPVLDVGTGKGLFAVELARTGMEVVSVDINDAERELAEALAEEARVRSRIRFVCEDAAHLSYPDGFFGCVATMDALHHLDEPSPVLGEMARVLGDAGTIVIADFNEQGFDLVSRIHRERGHIHPRTAATVALAQDELLRKGFQLFKQKTGYFHDIVIMPKI
jgi:ubiquinone/menaquinone biosynthesis C-methylase UbiE